MNITSLAPSILILLGAVIMAINLFKFKSTLPLLDQFKVKEHAELKIFCNFHKVLIFFFLFGYIIVFFSFISKIQIVGELLVGIIFLFVALFVLLGILLQERMFDSARDSYSNLMGTASKLEQEQQQLLETNKNLLLEIKKRMRAEEELKLYRDTLEEKVRERTAELKTVNAELLAEIHERGRIERRSRRLTTAIEQAVDSISITDIDGTIQYVNPAFENIYGSDTESLVGTNLFSLIFLKNKEMISRIRLSLAQEDSWNGRTDMKKGEGSIHIVDLTISLVRDSFGNPTNYVSVIHDVTHEVRLGRQLRQSRKMEAIGTLAGGIAHEFNNILAAVSGFTALASHSLDKEHPAAAHIEKILEGHNRAKNLIKKILAFSRQIEQERKPISIRPVIKEALDLIEASAPSSITIQTDISPDTGKILADPSLLQQLIMNLCSNACNAMKGTGGILKVGLSEVHLDSTSLEQHPDITPGTFLKISVSDTGHGMEKDIVERIFDPFFTTQDVSEKTGMGLAVAHGIIENLGGIITVQSEPEKGTLFNVYFPQIASAGKEEDVVTIPPSGNERILFIDDEKEKLSAGRRLLEFLGYEVTTADGGIDAMEIFQADPEKFDLVITDHNIPVMTGLAMTKKLFDKRPDLPVILCTEVTDNILEEEWKTAGIRKNIIKPLAVGELANTIREVLDA
ncbi:MAG: PAS domain S-box protein [Desulfobulbaceae bacterium]|nr:PAS domain S-box protein [Desulfobulbaceae bacterium]